MAALVLASIVVFVGLLIYARRNAKRYAGGALAVEHEVARRRNMPTDEVQAMAERIIATHALVEPWDGDGAIAVASELARLPPDQQRLLGTQKRLRFPVDDVVLSADLIGSGLTSVPVGMSHIGFADDSEYVIYAYLDGRPDVIILRASDGRPEMQFASVFHLVPSWPIRISANARARRVSRRQRPDECRSCRGSGVHPSVYYRLLGVASESRA